MIRGLQVAAACVILPLSMMPLFAHAPAIATYTLAHPLIPLLLALVFGILFGFVGRKYGLAGLFWHDRLRTRLGAATAVTLLTGLSGVFVYQTAAPTETAVNSVLRRYAPRAEARPASD